MIRDHVEKTKRDQDAVTRGIPMSNTTVRRDSTERQQICLPWGTGKKPMV